MSGSSHIGSICVPCKSWVPFVPLTGEQCRGVRDLVNWVDFVVGGANWRGGEHLIAIRGVRGCLLNSFGCSFRFEPGVSNRGFIKSNRKCSLRCGHHGSA